jgi:hypothetical protein
MDYPRRPFSGDHAEAAYLLGFRAGDLNVRMDLPTSQTIQVRSSTTRPAQVELIRQLFAPYGHVHTRLGKFGETQIECHLDMSFSFLLEKPESVPAWILAGDAYFWAFLAGYMDAEAYLGFTRDGSYVSGRVEIASCDVDILYGLWAALNARDAECRPPYLKRRAGTIDKRGRPMNRDYYCLCADRHVSADNSGGQITAR